MFQRPAVRTVVVILFAALAVASIGLNVQINSWLRADRQSAAYTQAALSSAEADLADLRAAQAAYLSVGQGVEVWMSRANDVAAELTSTISNLQATRSPEAGAHYDTAAAAMKSVAALDVKARDFIVSGQRFMASDVVFMDGLEANKRVGQALAEARESEEASAEARIGKFERTRLAAGAGALAFGVIVALALRRPVQPAVEAVTVSSLPADEASWKAKAGEPFVDPWLSPGVDLASTAELCVDLARVLDERDLPALLGRTANVLGAKGVVLWIADTTAGDLRPSMAHGYGDKVLQRMGSLTIGADNVTSVAFRTMAPQVIKGSADAAGAIAVPLLSAAGCVGVLSAELNTGTSAETASSVARMVASQLATLVAPSVSLPAQRVAEA